MEIEDFNTQMTIDGYETVPAPLKHERYVSTQLQKDANLFKITKRILLSADPEIIEFVCYSPNVAAHCKPGQFVIVRANEKAERIPLTIADFDRHTLEVTLVCQSIGRSSKIINALQ